MRLQGLILLVSVSAYVVTMTIANVIGGRD